MDPEVSCRLPTAVHVRMYRGPLRNFSIHEPEVFCQSARITPAPQDEYEYKTLPVT